MNQNSIPDRLKAARGQRSTAEVAAAVGTSRSAIQMYECGLRVPKDSIKVKLANFYQTTVQDLFF